MLSNFFDKSNNDRNYIIRTLLLLLIVAYIAYNKTLERLDFILYDTYLSLQHPKQDSRIAIIEIDDSSLKELGQWPWSRSMHARLIDRLSTIQNRALAFDLLFTESQESDSESDQLLAEAITRHAHVILPVAPITESPHDAIGFARPLPMFAEHAKLGHADVEVDQDGVVRRVFLYAGIDAATWPTLSLTLMNNFNAAYELSSIRKDAQKLSDNVKTWVRSTEVLIPYMSEFGAFHRISYVQALFDDTALQNLKDKAIFVGITATGMGTRIATPMTSVNHQLMTGIEWHANIFSMLSSNQMIDPISEVAAAIISVLWVGFILLLLVFIKQELTVPASLIFFVSGLIICGVLLKFALIWIPPSAAMLGALFLYPLENWQRINRFVSAFWIHKIRTSAALESIGDGVIITDNFEVVIYANKGAEKILQMPFSQLEGKMLHEILSFYSDSNHSNISHLQPNVLAPTIKTTNVPEEYSISTPHGDARTVRVVRNEFYDERSTKMGSVVAMTDITDTVELAKRVAFQKNYDALTELPNRSQLLTQFDRMIKVAESTQKVITVFFITLDNFKKINDAMGHHAGDKLLKMLSTRFFEVLQQGDIVGRWGGDEFVLLSEHLSSESLVIDMAQRLLEIIRQRFEIDDLEVFVSASIGISFYPENGFTSEIVVKMAGTAMYRIKEDGGNQYGLYSPELSAAWTREQITLEKELRTAIKQHELQVFFQPIINIQSNSITRMEALVRWPHPKRGYLSPGSFIPLAENIRQIEQLGEMVLKESCEVACKLIKLGYPINVSVNLNPRQLINRNLPQIISQTLHDTGLPSQCLILEMTENAIVSDMERASKILSEIKKLNISIALDDFGTGYSSLTLLRELPIDILKIDKSFVYKLGENPNDLKIVQAIIGLGENLGLTVIAEGVETKQQVDLLTKHGCILQQGYYFSRPVPYAALFKLMQDSKGTITSKDLIEVTDSESCKVC